MTSRDRDAASECVLRFTSTFVSDDASLIPTPELRERIAKHEKVILIDVRTSDEQRVSMIPGALSKDTFEADVLPALSQDAGTARPESDAPGSTQQAAPLVVPYCTVGYRSGMYCRELTGTHKLSNVRNGEGIIMWTFDGGSLVQPLLGPNGEPSQAPALQETAAAWVQADGEAKGPETVQIVHVYGKPWDFAAEGYNTVYFSPAVGAWKFLRGKCGGGVNPAAVLWLWTLAIFYLLFTPACGVMYRCACQMGLTKWGQVKSCHIFTDPAAHKCPWCSCTGLPCLFVSSDRKALRDVPLLDMLPDGCFLTVVTVLVLHLCWQRLDRCFGVARKSRPPSKPGGTKARHESMWSLHFAVKALVPVIWFLVYTVTMGALFLAFSPDYPYFFGRVRG